ncbi:hypothetical protein FIBSPDRAFT_876284 [Athelia psychrophila]|uniref:Secreted protein n=1 Tax=Athelia psychrophila TaxID=1759441 RepID=A0A167X050_9AGAM|nr:hypothetical protein FIBSPDRAFT_876284 [Fibularhizoctonia sp. CBS 109695]
MLLAMLMCTSASLPAGGSSTQVYTSNSDTSTSSLHKMHSVSLLRQHLSLTNSVHRPQDDCSECAYLISVGTGPVSRTTGDGVERRD